jgi:hypothetical protein
MADVTLTNCTLSGFTRAPNGERQSGETCLYHY